MSRGGDCGNCVGLDTDRWPRLTALLLAYLARHAPDENWVVTSIYVAFCKPNARTLENHRDKGNVGPSYLMGIGKSPFFLVFTLSVGNYDGGALRLPGRGAAPFDVSIAANRRRSGHPFFIFNARDELHGVESFAGERVSVSYYALRHSARLAPRDCARLTALGFRFPTGEMKAGEL